GRVCLPIFGLRAGAPADVPGAERLADDLGVALQLTNILRDVAEDAANGRVYLPAEDLRRFGLLSGGERPDGRGGASDILAAIGARAAATGGGPERRATDERLSALVHFEARRAREW